MPYVRDLSTTDLQSESEPLLSLGFELGDEKFCGIPTKYYSFPFYLRPDTATYSDSLSISQLSSRKEENSPCYSNSPLSNVLSSTEASNRTIPLDSDYDFNNFLDRVFSDSLTAITPTNKFSCDCKCHFEPYQIPNRVSLRDY